MGEVVQKRLQINRPANCAECGGEGIIYKRISEVNAYFVECDGCGANSPRFECVEDAVDAWDVWEVNTGKQ